MDGCVEMRKFWTPEEDAKLRELWPLKTSFQLVPIFGRSRVAIIGRAHRLGMRKGHPEYLIRSTKVEKRNPAENFGISVSPKRTQDDVWSISAFTDSLPFKGIPLMELKLHHCRYVKEPAEMTYCGHNRRPGSSYCEAHHNRFHTTAKEKET